MTVGSDGTVFFLETKTGKFGYVGPSGTVAETVTGPEGRWN